MVGGPFFCAMTYKTRLDSSEDDDVNIGQPSKVVVSRTCLSSDDLSNYKRQFGSDLVGIDSVDGALETHLFYCSDVSGCNWRFPGAGDGQSPIDQRRGESTEEEVTSCYVCNDKSSSTCSLSAEDSTEMDDETVRRCPVDQSHGCVLWYKVQLDTDEIVTVVRSCLSSEDADTYRASYDTIDSNTSVIYVKEEAEDRSIYFLTMCFQSRCNLHFPVFQQQTPFCFICSEYLDDKCDAEGSGLSPAHLDRCQHPSDLCSLSYVVRLSSSSGQKLRPTDVRRSCLSRSRAGEYQQQQQQRHSSTERGGGDLIVIPVSDQSIADTHLYLCRSSECNRRLPDDLRDSIPEPALRCFTCSQHMPSGGPCGAVVETGAFVSRCEGSKGEEQRCFMSYVLAADGSQTHFNRSCVSASEILSLRRLFGPELIATDVAASDQLQHHRYMFHCKGNLCNGRFPSTPAAHQSTIDCYTCGDDDNPSPSSSSSTSSSSSCGVDGSALPASALRPCSVFDRFFCAIVAKYNMSSSPEALLISMRRSCISERDATAYTTKGIRLEDVDGGGGTKEENDAAAVVVYEERETGSGAFFKNFLFICQTNGCNANFPQLSKIVERHQAVVAIGVPGPVINEARKTKPSGAASSDQSPPRSGASRSKDSGAAHRPILALGSHLATVATLIVASSVFGR